MCKFSHFRKAEREKISKYVTFTFVLSILLHGLTQISTSIWLLVTSYNACAFLQKYYVPIYTHSLSGVSAAFIALTSIIWTHCLHINCHVRYFVISIGLIISLEIASILSAVVLDNLATSELSVTMATSLNFALYDKNNSTSEEHKDCWMDLQNHYKCCGVNDVTDWCTYSKNSTNCELQSNFLESCKCSPRKSNKHNKCYLFNNETLHETSCLAEATHMLTSINRLIIVMDSSFCIMQCITYIVVNYILTRINTHSVIDVYKTKQTENESKL